MGKRRDWPSAEAVAEMLAHIGANEREILETHHLIGTETDHHVVIVQNGRLFDLLADDVYVKTLAGVLKAAGKPLYPTENDIPGLVIGDVSVDLEQP